VAAPHPLAIRAGEDMADRGGNAIDAAVAAAMTLTVVYPHMTGVGGDLFALVRRPDGSTYSINASGAYGSALDEVPPVPLLGPRAVTVPGAASGWARLLELDGSVAAAELLEPVIALAADGTPVCAGLAEAVRELADEGKASPQLLALLDGCDREGATLRQPALAETLRTLAAEGLASLYAGTLAERLSRGFAELGVPVTAADLRRHDVRVEEPWSVDAATVRVSTAPPNSQGYLLLALLNAGAATPAVNRAALERLFARAEQCRDAELADPAYVRSDKRELLDPARLLDEPSPPVAVPRAHGDTIAVTAVGADGTTVSLIQSLFHSFGSQVLEPGTGLVLHNRGALFSADPTSPNAPAPGKRPAHTLMPVVVEHADGRVSAHGAMGGRAQPQIHLQVLRNVLGGRSAQEAVSAPRFVVRDGQVLAEPEHTDETGHAMICTLAPDGTLSAGIDPRSDGWPAGD
jgi:gamma-glutamyltranspeptidase/glutathione hydrolase